MVSGWHLEVPPDLTGSAGPPGGPVEPVRVPPDPMGSGGTHLGSAGPTWGPADLPEGPPDLHQPIRIQLLVSNQSEGSTARMRQYQPI